ncbi:RNA ligase family protein [Hazenella coriacea]|uniref:RNA ligase n=1 Tax=Hazenella coriacea TaxID=1179467 RepID=A0A4V2UUZ9_9BACL|nr:RNA ligase family protein [Hazenella coriacea]TCS93797.1 RNA ligase [Hazenella coriacea]
MNQIYKYPRTPHIEGSGLQTGDDDLQIASFKQICNRFLVIEEKMDGANCGISFDRHGELFLQSRGHYLTGGAREQQFHLFKSWAYGFASDLWSLLSDRYIMYGEWLYAKHTIFYTDLPHYFLEFDIFDKETHTFLSTARRMEMLRKAPFIHSVRVLHEGKLKSHTQLSSWVAPSPFIDHPQLKQKLQSIATQHGVDPDQILRETDLSGQMEGLYIKVEEEDIVKERYKLVRKDFIQTIIESQSHWMNRPLIPNQLKGGQFIWRLHLM